ncbi:hypothetical protein [Brevundimonas diminuta]|uniref:hypothetical protein n=1 Tax=Brevundimonas diminuta TaxID=293 RepID=UPI0035E2B31A
MTTITRLYDTHTEAMAAVSALEAAGFDADDVSILSNNAENWHQGHRHEGRTLGDMNGDGENDIAEGAGKGAATGGVLGVGAGVLAGLGMLAIPGLGPVVAAGWLASAAAAGAVGAAAGGAAGGILGALKEAGHDDDEAHVYAEGVRRGGTLVSVRVHENDRMRAQAILDESRGWDAGARGAAYRQGGWSRFDPAGVPYTTDQIAEERARYR